MADSKLIAILASGRAFAVRIESEQQSLESALNDLTGRTGGGAQPEGWTKKKWLDTEEGFRIRRKAIVAFVIGRKEGEWAVADS